MGRCFRFDTGVLIALLVLTSGPAPGRAQEMPKRDYYTYVPLSYTRPIRQAAGTAALGIYGDRSDPA